MILFLGSILLFSFYSLLLVDETVEFEAEFENFYISSFTKDLWVFGSSIKDEGFVVVENLRLPLYYSTAIINEFSLFSIEDYSHAVVAAGASLLRIYLRNSGLR